MDMSPLSVSVRTRIEESEYRMTAKRPRLTLDVTPELRRRIRIAAAEEDLSVRDYVVGILER